MAKKTKYVRLIRQLTDENGMRPINSVAKVIENIKSDTKDCIMIQFQEEAPLAYHLNHLEYITKKEYFVRCLQGPDEIE